MPCRTGDEECYINPKESGFNHNSKVAEMLCSIISNIGINEIILLLKKKADEYDKSKVTNCIDMNINEIKKWWEEHAERDEMLAERDFINHLHVCAEQYLNSLSSYNRKLIKYYDLNLKINENDN